MPQPMPRSDVGVGKRTQIAEISPASFCCEISGPVALACPVSVRFLVGPLNVETQKVLPIGEYEAIYSTTWQETVGTYKVESCVATATLGWMSKGIFTRISEHRQK
jgi:hypothetical protein